MHESFDSLPLTAEMRETLAGLGYKKPSPVQSAAFERVVAGVDLVVQARTGTGKTAAFGLPILDQLVRKGTKAVQALVLAPTRELALQVAREFEKLATKKELTILPVYGGVSMQPQIDALANGVHVVVGTPGRVLDHLRRGTLDVKALRIFVLDEADELLSMGFQRELYSIIELLPKTRQGLYFSATIPTDVQRLASNHLRDPEYLTLSSDQVGALEITHAAYHVRGDKRAALLRVIQTEQPESAIVFCNTKDETERTAKALRDAGFAADAINGDLDQKDRERVMDRTRKGEVRFLVATDVASRGIDISHLTHVINADFPESAESYVHRTGRTGRAGRTGAAVSLIAPQDIGHLYMLRLTYKIRMTERYLPTEEELRSRTEKDAVESLISGFVRGDTTEKDRAISRRLMTHDRAEEILAALVRIARGEKPLPPEATVATVQASDSKPRQREPHRRNEARNAEHSNGGPRTNPRTQPQDAAAREARQAEPRREREDRPRREQTSVVESNPDWPIIFLNVGTRDGLRPDVLDGLLTSEVGLPKSSVGSIRMRDKMTYVSVHPESATRVIEGLKGRTFGSRTLTPELARAR